MIVRNGLAERVLDCFPSGNYALSALLQLLDVVETDEVETAAVECRLEPRLKINPAFVDEWAATPEKLLILVMHELHHVLLGHTRLFPRVTPIDNLVFDAIINALLCRMFPEPEFTSFFTHFYDDASFPECLLRPPTNWHPDTEIPVPPALATPERRGIAEVYRALYSPAGAGYDELYGVFWNELADTELRIALIGDHGFGDDDSSAGNIETRSPLLFEIVRSIVERWPQPPNPVAGRSLNDILTDEHVSSVRVISNRTILRRLMKRVGGVSRSHRVHRSRCDEPVTVSQPVRNRDRRATVLDALGSPIVLYRKTMTRPGWDRTGQRVHIYLDVSGSIGDLKGVLYSAVLDCQDIVHPTIHLFSTKVVDISLNQLRRGECMTTGGTDICCITQHMRENKVQRAVIITDGWVGRPSGEDAVTLGKATIGVALTPTYNQRTDLEDVVDYWAQLADIGGIE